MSQSVPRIALHVHWTMSGRWRLPRSAAAAMRRLWVAARRLCGDPAELRVSAEWLLEWEQQSCKHRDPT